MDEPTAGLDPNQIREVRKLIRELSSSKTVLLSTHILQEVEAVADHVVIISEGRIVFDGTPAEMAAGEGLDAAFERLTQPRGGEQSPASPDPPPDDISVSDAVSSSEQQGGER